MGAGRHRCFHHPPVDHRVDHLIADVLEAGVVEDPNQVRTVGLGHLLQRGHAPHGRREPGASAKRSNHPLLRLSWPDRAAKQQKSRKNSE
jgi:hypothetical protein